MSDRTGWLLVGMTLGALAFVAGQAYGRYQVTTEAPIVCGDSLHPSGIHVAPTRYPRPTDPVRTAP